VTASSSGETQWRQVWDFNLDVLLLIVVSTLVRCLCNRRRGTCAFVRETTTTVAVRRFITVRAQRSFRPLRDACHTRLTTGGGGIGIAYSRGADTAPPAPGQSACSPGTLWPVTSGRYRLEQGRPGEVIYERPPGPVHRLVLLL